MLLTYGSTVQSRLANSLWLRGQKAAGIHLGAPRGPVWGVGVCSSTLQFQAGASECSRLLGSCHPQICPNMKSQEKKPALLPPAPEHQALFHPLSYVSTMSNSENENEKSRLTDLSCPHGLENLGKGPTCLCPLWGHVRRKPL